MRSITRVSRWVVLVVFVALTLPRCLAAPPKSLTISVSFDPRDNLRQTRGFGVSLDNFSDQEVANDRVNLLNAENWQITYRGSRLQVSGLTERLRVVEMQCGCAGVPSYQSLHVGELVAIYTSPGQNPITGTFTLKPKASPLSFVDTAKDADISISGDIQTAVSAKPQYEWDIEAKYPVTLFRRYGNIAPSVSSKASQQTNADPDSSKVSAVYEKVLAVRSTRQGVILNADLIGYEFERKAKQEAVLVNGQAKLQDYSQKNTNLVWADTVHYVPSVLFGNTSINIGTEYGRASSRSVHTTGTTTTYDDSILRSTIGVDLYQNFFLHCPSFSKPCNGSDKVPWVSFDGHYTLRSPFKPEPYKQTYVNSGNEFLSTKPRHYANLNAKLALHSGIALLFKYEYGSLPPTFTFLDNQLTVGLQVLLKHN